MMPNAFVVAILILALGKSWCCCGVFGATAKAPQPGSHSCCHSPEAPTPTPEPERECLCRSQFGQLSESLPSLKAPERDPLIQSGPVPEHRLLSLLSGPPPALSPPGLALGHPPGEPPPLYLLHSVWRC